MELAYDKIQAEQEDLLAEPATSTSVQSPSSLDKAADKLEAGIEQAFARFSSTNWGGLWNTVKQQGEAAFNETKKEVEAALKKANGAPNDDESVATAAAETTPTASSSNLNASTVTVTSDNVQNDAAMDKDATAPGSAMLAALSKRAQVYIDELDRDLEKMENAAGSYILRLGKDVKSILKDAVTVDAPDANGRRRHRSDSESGEDAPAEILFNVPEGLRNQIYSTRLDAQLHALHTSQEPFLTTTEEPDYQKFKESFDVSAQTDEIASDLEKHPKLRKLMESLIPDQVSYEIFWTKYYYMRKQIAEQETRRKQLLQQAASGAEHDINWDDDDEEEPEGETQQAKAASKSADTSRGPESSRPSSESSYDLISKNESALNLAKQDVPPTTEEESDDDWE